MIAGCDGMSPPGLGGSAVMLRLFLRYCVNFNVARGAYLEVQSLITAISQSLYTNVNLQIDCRSPADKTGLTNKP